MTLKMANVHATFHPAGRRARHANPSDPREDPAKKAWRFPINLLTEAQKKMLNTTNSYAWCEVRRSSAHPS